MKEIPFAALDQCDLSVVHFSACNPIWHNGDQTRHDTQPRTTSLLMYLQRGEWQYEYGGRVRETVHVGNVLFLPIGCRYVSRCITADTAQAICLDFHLIDECGEELSIGTVPQILADDAVGRYEPLFLQALRAYLLGSGGKLAGKSAVFRLLDELARQTRRDALPPEAESLLPVLDLLEHHPERAVSVPELAAICFLSESVFRRRFRAHTGVSPVEYRNRIRVRKADELLRSGLYTVESAAEQLGFTDGSHFCKVYRRICGHAPRAK